MTPVAPIVRPLVIAVSVLLVAGGCIRASLPDAETQRSEVAAIEAAFPLLDEMHVEHFEDTEVCRALWYPRGKFADPSDTESRCWDDEMTALDDAALNDLRRISDALDGAPIGVNRGFLVFDGDGIRSATFNVSGGAFDRFTFYYDRSATPFEPDPDTVTSSQINERWSFASEDWN